MFIYICICIYISVVPKHKSVIIFVVVIIYVKYRISRIIYLPMPNNEYLKTIGVHKF